MAGMDRPVDRRGRWAFGLSVGAVAWCAFIVVGAFLIPAYTEQGADSAGHTFTDTQTLVQVKGLGVLIPVSIPLVLTIGVWLLLRRRCTTGGRLSRAGASTLITVVWLVTLLTGFSIGFLVLPVAVLLTIAARLTPTASTASMAATA
jgi:hypothetical protein